MKLWLFCLVIGAFAGLVLLIAAMRLLILGGSVGPEAGMAVTLGVIMKKPLAATLIGDGKFSKIPRPQLKCYEQ